MWGSNAPTSPGGVGWVRNQSRWRLLKVAPRVPRKESGSRGGELGWRRTVRSSPSQSTQEGKGGVGWAEGEPKLPDSTSRRFEAGLPLLLHSGHGVSSPGVMGSLRRQSQPSGGGGASAFPAPPAATTPRTCDSFVFPTGPLPSPWGNAYNPTPKHTWGTLKGLSPFRVVILELGSHPSK